MSRMSETVKEGELHMRDTPETSVTETLESMIDKHGLLHIITGLELVCGDKAEHLRVNWQDKVTARAWDRVANRLRVAAEGAADL